MDKMYLLFENYLQKLLSDEERTNFEEKLTTDNNFKEDFILYKKTSNFLAQKEKNKKDLNLFTENVSKISTNYFDKTVKSTKKQFLKPWYYSIVASLLIIFSVYMYTNNNTPTYGSFVQYNTIELTVRSEQNKLFKKAEIAFNEKKFKEASTYFSELIKNDSENIELQLYNAFTQIEINNFTSADHALQKIANGNSIFKNDANWYLALSKLKQKNYDACVVILKKITKEADTYQKAQKLLSKLK